MLFIFGQRHPMLAFTVGALDGIPADPTTKGGHLTPRARCMPTLPHTV